MRLLSKSTLARTRTRAMDVVPIAAAAVFSLCVVAEAALSAQRAHHVVGESVQLLSTVKCSVTSIADRQSACQPGVGVPDRPFIPLPGH